MAKRYQKEIIRWSTMKCSDESKRFGVVAERTGNYYKIRFATNKTEDKFFCEICGKYHEANLCEKEDIIRVKSKNIFRWFEKNKYTEE